MLRHLYIELDESLLCLRPSWLLVWANSSWIDQNRQIDLLEFLVPQEFKWKHFVKFRVCSHLKALVLLNKPCLESTLFLVI